MENVFTGLHAPPLSPNLLSNAWMVALAHRILHLLAPTKVCDFTIDYASIMTVKSGISHDESSQGLLSRVKKEPPSLECFHCQSRVFQMAHHLLSNTFTMEMYKYLNPPIRLLRPCSCSQSTSFITTAFSMHTHQPCFLPPWLALSGLK